MRPCASRIGAASAREFCFSDFAGSSPDGYSPQRAADGHGQFPCISGPRRARQRPRPRQLNSRAPRTPVPSDRAAAPCVSSAGHRTGASASRSAIADGRSRLDRRRPWRWPPPTPPRPGRPGCFLEALAALRDQGRPQRGDVVGEVLGHEPPKGPESSPRQRFDHGRRQPGRDRSRDPHARLPRKFDLAANTIIRTSAYQPIPPQLRKAAITGGLRFPSGAAQLHRVRERQSWLVVDRSRVGFGDRSSSNPVSLRGFRARSLLPCRGDANGLRRRDQVVYALASLGDLDLLGAAGELMSARPVIPRDGRT